MDFDTGSSDLVLPASNCDFTCSGHTLYDPSLSTTSVDVGRTFDLQFGDGSAIGGEQYTDTVSLAGYMVGPWHVLANDLPISLLGHWAENWGGRDLLQWLLV